jgi:predicted nucleotidyltransferase
MELPATTDPHRHDALNRTTAAISPNGEYASDSFDRALALAKQYGSLDHVRAVVLVGSVAAGASDATSDIDLCVYSTAPVPISGRAAIAAGDPQAELDNRWFGPEDAWADAETGVIIDVAYRDVAWIVDDLARILVRHQARLGYTTAVWASVLASRPLVDPTGWFALLQQQARQPYPPLLRQARSSYTHQLAQAVARDDWTSVNHRVTAFLASYFDILFALNSVPHPGEKRLVPFAVEHCQLVPAGMPAQLAALLRAAGDTGREVVGLTDALSVELERLVYKHGDPSA